ncbi:hypothetical protein ACJX0J_023868, partial [Zea mays]
TDSDSLMENGYARPVEGISVAALYAGFADTVLLKTKHRQCTSGLQDVADVAVAIKAGPYDIGIVAGLQSKTVNKVSLVEQMNSKVELFSQAHGCFFPNGLTYENIAHCFGTTRLQPDQADVESHPGKSKDGLVIYSVAYVGDSCEHRFITHRPSFVGMVILYGDPNELHYRQNAFDAGEEGLEIKVHSPSGAIVFFMTVSPTQNFKSVFRHFVTHPYKCEPQSTPHQALPCCAVGRGHHRLLHAIPLSGFKRISNEVSPKATSCPTMGTSSEDLIEATTGSEVDLASASSRPYPWQCLTGHGPGSLMGSRLPSRSPWSFWEARRSLQQRVHVHLSRQHVRQILYNVVGVNMHASSAPAAATLAAE